MKTKISVRFLLFILVLMMTSVASLGQVRISVAFGPPALPVYEQPVCPGDDYLWTPGYWAYDDEVDDYYWVPGTWVLAPEPGFLWTPGYWAWGGDSFIFYDGYWGPEVGFYGGIAYGFGYFGVGFVGGRWDGGHFFYNQAVMNVNVSIHNVYRTEVVNNVTNINRVSYNGGNGGVIARPTPQEEAAAHDRHISPVPAQTQHMQQARSNPQMRASANQGRPPIAATERPGAFSGSGVVAAREAGAPYHPPANRGGPRSAETAGHPESNHPEDAGAASGARPATAVHPRDLPPPQRPAMPNTGDPKLDKKYQKEQQKLAAQQDKERLKLQQKQDQEHQRMAQKQADAAKTQQLEQKHQLQTQQLQQRHQTQQQQLQQRQQPVRPSEPRPKG